MLFLYDNFIIFAQSKAMTKGLSVSPTCFTHYHFNPTYQLIWQLLNKKSGSPL